MASAGRRSGPGSSEVGRTLPGRAYFCPELFARELDAIFGACWLCAGRLAELSAPGAYLVRQVGDESLLLVGDGTRVRAFYNVCRHRGARLCLEGRGVVRGSLQCPYHGWTYGLDGRLRRAPNLPAGVELPWDELALAQLRVDTWRGFVWVHLDPEAPGLRQELGDLWDYYDAYPLEGLAVHRTLEYEVRANWKILMENFQECYHCRLVHPELSRVTPPLRPRRTAPADPRPWRPSAVWPGPSYGMELAPGFSTLTARGRSRRRTFPGLSEHDARGVYYATVYPNFLLGLAPDYVVTLTLWPQEAERTRVVAQWLFEPEALAQEDFDGDEAVELWDLTNRQDWQVCELAQQGSRSRAFRQGGVLVPHEADTALFVDWVRRRMGYQADGQEIYTR
ncbi:MAG TPA: aromatic ring-hydroxylating dioxygenase subunit alpha [Candidatus Nitrosotenuis sp.]|jgi:Rieske 2Fe-2S family protein|nr:aromatic ring-hydroxylating dioxygenase subunit alpha [Candidatus Nitrosotenuis sp.]